MNCNNTESGFMKKIVFIRHAKAEKRTAVDFERRLSKSGIKESELLGESLKLDNFICDLIVSSDSMRTFETAEIVGSYLNVKKREIQTEHKLYQGTRIETYYRIIRNLSDEVNNILVVGHNTTLEDMISDICPSFKNRLNTASAVCVKCNVQHWNQIKSSSGQFEFYKFNKSKKRIGDKEKKFVEKIVTKFNKELSSAVKEIDRFIMFENSQVIIEKISKSAKNYIKDSNIVTVHNLSDFIN